MSRGTLPGDRPAEPSPEVSTGRAHHRLSHLPSSSALFCLLPLLHDTMAYTAWGRAGTPTLPSPVGFLSPSWIRVKSPPAP